MYSKCFHILGTKPVRWVCWVPSYVARHPSWLLLSTLVKLIIMYNVYLVYCGHVKYWKFFAVRRVSLMTYGECRVDCLFPNHTTRWGWEPAPPLQYGHWTTYLTPFLRLNSQTSKCCHMDLWSARLVLIHPHLHWLHPYLLQLQPMEPRVSILSF